MLKQSSTYRQRFLYEINNTSSSVFYLFISMSLSILFVSFPVKSKYLQKTDLDEYFKILMKKKHDKENKNWCTESIF